MENRRKKIILMADHGMSVKIAEAFRDVKLKDCDKPQIVVIDDEKKDSYTIEVNGVKYKRIEKEEPKRSGKFNRIAEMTLALGGIGINGASNEPRKRPNVDIIKEYGLIELKQSNLSRSDRDWVKWQFEQGYKKIGDGTNNT